MTTCIVDTSILDELLNIPQWAHSHDTIVEEFEVRVKERESFLLPIGVVIEAGNHVAQVGDGGARRIAAMRFVEFVRRALDGTLPFVPTPFPDSHDLGLWLSDFAETYAAKSIGLVDRSLIALWEAQRALQPHRRVYIWTLDNALVGYDSSISW